ncbi:MAG: LamG domain-containing protein, partial [Cytophagales bacterium]|nr:LamG domain-containing protein [Cytophagales bacterium]
SGNLAVEIDDGLGNYASSITTTTYNDGIWHHVAMTRKGNAANLYVDGINITTLTTTGIPNVSRGVGFLIGFRYADSPIPIGFFKGQMDGIRLWNRALCQAEIQSYRYGERPSNTTGLRARYDFNQGLSKGVNTGVVTLFDSSGNANHATLYNFGLNGASSNWISPGAVLAGSTTASVSCIPGAALDFNGFNSYVSTNLWSDTLKNFTLEASVKWRGGNGQNQSILYNGLSSSNGYGVVIQHGSAPADQLTILMGGVLWNTTGTILTTNTWNKIAIVNDNGVWSFYLNGSLLALSNYTTVPNSITGISNSLIGNNENYTSGFNGTIDNVRFWSRPLCQAEINAHLSCEKPANNAGLIARYDFNSGIAGDNNAGVITAIDSSGNGNHGTLNNFSLTSTISNWVAPGAVLSGSTCAGVTIPAGGTWTWVGGNSTDWFSPCNWDKLSVPTAAADVVIPGGTLYAPTITGSPAYCNTILVNTSNGGVVNLDASGGGVLNITQ